MRVGERLIAHWEVRARQRVFRMVFIAAVTLAPSIVIAVDATTATASSPPVARADVARTNAGTGVTVFVTSNDFDPDFDSFDVVAVETPAHGSVTFGSSYISYTPDTGFSGPESITYTIRDSTGAAATGILTVWVDTTVIGAESPLAFADYFYVKQGESIGFSTAQLLSNDNDPQSQALSVVAVSDPGNDGVLTGSAANGGLSYTPSTDPTFANVETQLDYLLLDPDGHVVQGEIKIQILAAGDTNQPPVARDDVTLVGAGGGASAFVLNNDFDPDGDGFSVVSVDTPAHGTIAFGSSFVSYFPVAGFVGADVVTYQIRDSHGLTATATVTVWVDSDANAGTPLPGTDYFYVYQGGSVGFTTAELLSNDTDPHGQALTVVAVSEPSNNGVLTGSAQSGGLSYTPGTDPSLINVESQLEYLVRDTDGHVSQGEIDIRILAAGDSNQPPVARDDVARANARTLVTSIVVDNDFDPDGDGFSVSAVAIPSHGIVVYGANYVSYTPNEGFSGTEVLTYQIRDSHGLTAFGTLTVWVDSAPFGIASPDAATDFFSAYQGGSVGFTTADLLSNDTDPYGQALSVVAVSEPSNNGVLTGSAQSGGLSYTPGTDPSLVNVESRLDYLVRDTDGHVSQGQIQIRILAAGDPNQPPVARDDVARTDSGAQVTVIVTGNDFDPDGDGFNVCRWRTRQTAGSTSSVPTTCGTRRTTGSPGRRRSRIRSETLTV